MTTKGLLALDAHTNQIDIFFTVVWVRKTYNPKKLYLPVAGYLLFVPLCKQFLAMFAKTYGVTILPVYRKSDKKPNGIISWFLTRWYPRALTDSIRNEANKRFLQAVDQLRTSQIAMVLSPYGGYGSFGKQIKYGAHYAIALHPKIIITRTRFSFTNMKFNTNKTTFTNTDMLRTQFNAL